MSLAEETVKGYRKRILLKMKVRNITHAVSTAKDFGII